MKQKLKCAKNKFLNSWRYPTHLTEPNSWYFTIHDDTSSVDFPVVFTRRASIVNVALILT